MRKSLILTAMAIMATIGMMLPQVRAQTLPGAKSAYMQIFYEGTTWITGRPLVHYSPSFQGKTGEVVGEDSTSILSPGAVLFDRPVTGELISTQSTDSKGNTTIYVPGKDGKMRPQTAADRQQAQKQESARFDRQLNLLEARATLARTTLLNALNAAATDGWEVVQMAPWGNKDGLVYLLRRR